MDWEPEDIAIRAISFGCGIGRYAEVEVGDGRFGREIRAYGDRRVAEAMARLSGTVGELTASIDSLGGAMDGLRSVLKPRQGE